MRLRVGFIVNPAAGAGGAVALKGSDGMDLQAMTKTAIITAMQQRHGVLLDRGLSKSALLAAARELEQAEHGSVAR